MEKIKCFQPAEAAKQASITTLIALGLSIFMLGLHSVQLESSLGLETRWTSVALLLFCVFAGRFLIVSFHQWQHWHKTQQITQQKATTADPALHFLQPLQNWFVQHKSLLFFLLGSLLFLLAVSLPFFPFSSRYVLDTATLVLTYIMLGWGLNIVVGLAGLLDLGYVAFYAIGAYSFAILSLHFHWTFWEALPVAGLCGGIFGVLLGYPVLRLRGDYLAIVTLGFGEIIRIILVNWSEVTGGPNGISDIPRPSLFGLEFTRSPAEGVTAFHQFFGVEFSSLHRIIFLYYLILLLALCTHFFTLRLRRLPIGRAWEALREDEIACRALGMNPTNIKLTAFGMGAMFGGFAGAFFATRQGFISPESFTFMESAVILAIVVLGGMGSQIGVVLAAIFLIGGTELFRNLEEYRMLVFGLGMVAIMVWKPRGLMSRREPTILLRE